MRVNVLVRVLAPKNEFRFCLRRSDERSKDRKVVVGAIIILLVICLVVIVVVTYCTYTVF